MDDAEVVVPGPLQVESFATIGRVAALGRPARPCADRAPDCAAVHVGAAVCRAERRRRRGLVLTVEDVDVVRVLRHHGADDERAAALLRERIGDVVLVHHRRHVVRRERVVLALRHVDRILAVDHAHRRRAEGAHADRRARKSNRLFKHRRSPFLFWRKDI